MKRILAAVLLLVFLTAGCLGGDRKEVEKSIQEAFKTRAEAVFLCKDKKPLERYFGPQAMEQSKAYLAWSPNGQWTNVKNLKYSTTLRINKLKISGKKATAEVLETAVVTWDYIDPAQVLGTAFLKEDAWSNRKHLVTLTLVPEGKWLIEQDVVQQ